jgi:hypothetical protein
MKIGFISEPTELATRLRGSAGGGGLGDRHK